ncbi:MAG: DNA topoisomerase IV subunit A [Alphaproteobacteria bacterium]|nr:DNA topoisomerase IV subunit A [Alphaproteobacteria bacterium]
MTEATPIKSGEAEEVHLKDALQERYLAYALATITNRALPDVRDGLKPVHRRLLFAMRRLHLSPEQSFKKSARVVGDVIGRYHPHGDQAVYDALVRLAQGFAVRYPLVDGQGNFGNVDGDNAAAMRYTEARLTAVSERLLADIDNDTVDFRATYDGEDEEPVLLPAAFPNLLANGATGIAVGMATNIPPHNIGELCSAALHLIKTPKARIDTLMEYVQGPDFPTGGICIETKDTLREIYATGRGTMRVRARYHIEEKERGTWALVITEIPYQVQKSRLIEKIAELMHARSLPLLDNIYDDSAEDIRIVLEPKSKNVLPEQLMASLYRRTDLETRFSMNMNVLDSKGVPRVMGLREALLEWLEHRNVVLVRKSKHREAQITNRLEILDGYLIAYLNLDEIIRIIREEDEPKRVMMKKFKFTETQAEAILNMRLRALRKLEEQKIRTEHKDLTAERVALRKLLKSRQMQDKIIADEIKEIKKTYSDKTELGKRRTTYEEAGEEEDVSLEMMVEKEPISVVCSQKGWIRAMRGHLENGKTLTYKDGDKAAFVLHAMTTDKLILFASNGRAHTIDASKLPGGRGHGDAVRLLADIAPEDEIVEIFVHDEKRQLLVASHIGNGFIVAEAELVSARRAGKSVLNVKSPDKAVQCVPVHGDSVAVLGRNKKLLCFPLAQVPEMSAGKKGVRLQRHGEGYLMGARCFTAKKGLSLTDKAGREKIFDDLKVYHGTRGQSGRKHPNGFPADGTMGTPFPNRL